MEYQRCIRSICICCSSVLRRWVSMTSFYEKEVVLFSYVLPLSLWKRYSDSLFRLPVEFSVLNEQTFHASILLLR